MLFVPILDRGDQYACWACMSSVGFAVDCTANKQRKPAVAVVVLVSLQGISVEFPIHHNIGVW